MVADLTVVRQPFLSIFDPHLNLIFTFALTSAIPEMYSSFSAIAFRREINLILQFGFLSDMLLCANYNDVTINRRSYNSIDYFIPKWTQCSSTSTYKARHSGSLLSAPHTYFYAAYKCDSATTSWYIHIYIQLLLSRWVHSLHI